MSRGVVFLTGASTGIGYATALRLANAGYDVIPGLRRDEPLPDPVKAPVLIDLADPDSIAPACKEVLERADGKLVAVINNAGINVNGPFEAIDLEAWRHQFEVNLFGHIATTLDLLPALLANGGRVITVGSIGGRLSVPFLSPYSASKSAVQAWMDAIRIELAPQGVKAILIEPGAIATPMWAKGNAAADVQIHALSDDHKRRYATQIEGARRTANMTERHAIPPERCAEVIERALSARRPKAHYIVGTDARVQAGVAVLPTAVLDRVINRIIGTPRSH
jgi:NAD(P)-dependent dehydrogenase (short-subunit alcohol dehydrogenase family)